MASNGHADLRRWDKMGYLVNGQLPARYLRPEARREMKSVMVIAGTNFNASGLLAAFQLRAQVPDYAFARFSSTADDVEREKIGRMLLYRSKQRGFLELDILMGLWAERSIPKMDMKQLASLAEVLDEENPDLFKWLTGQLPPSERMAANPSFLAIREDVGSQLEGKSFAGSRSTGGKEWVRGWDDNWRKPPAPAAPSS
eukprot:gene3935-14012_t